MDKAVLVSFNGGKIIIENKCLTSVNIDTIVWSDEASKSDERKGDWKMEVLKAMTAREVLNLIEWLKSKNFTSDDIVDCIEYIEGKKNKGEEDKED